MKKEHCKKMVMTIMALACIGFSAACSADGTVDTAGTGGEHTSGQSTFAGDETVNENTESTEEFQPVYPEGLCLPEGTVIGEYFTGEGRGNSAGWYIETDRSQWENPYPEANHIPSIYQADGWIELHEPDDVLQNGEGVPYIPANHMETVQCEELQDQRLWLTQVEVELYTNTEIGTYGISEQDNIVRYWCIVHSGEQVSFLFLRQNDFTESEIREIISQSYPVQTE